MTASVSPQKTNGHTYDAWLECLVASIRQREDVSVLIDLAAVGREPIAVWAPRESVRLQDQLVPPVGSELKAYVGARIVEQADGYSLVELLDQGRPARHLVPQEALRQF